MTTLRDPFETVHKKDIKNKAGVVVAQVDYVGWSQVADRLDDVDPSWSFEVVNLGTDWCLGSLRIGTRTFQNIGYAENADMDWKKEPLKDAVSDAFKRCAALAGVARYLYDKDTPRPQNGPQRPVQPRSAPPPAAPRPAPAAGVPQEPEWMGGPSEVPQHLRAVTDTPLDPRDGFYGDTCPVHKGRPWKDTKYGPKCTAQDPESKSGYCVWKPSKRWIAEHETAGVAS